MSSVFENLVKRLDQLPVVQRDQKWFYRARKSVEEKQEAELVIDMEKLDDSDEEDTVEPNTTEENIEPNTGVVGKFSWIFGYSGYSE